MVVFVVEQTLLGVVPFESVLLFQQTQDLPAHWDHVHSDYQPLLRRRRCVHLVEPTVSADVRHCVPLHWVRAQDALEEVNGVFRYEFRNLEVAFEDLLVQVGGVRVFKGQVPAYQSEQNDAAAPHVHIGPVVPLSGYHLWGRVTRTAARCLQCISSLVSVRQPEIDDFDVFVLVEQQVLGFEVSVHDVE